MMMQEKCLNPFQLILSRLTASFSFTTSIDVQQFASSKNKRPKESSDYIILKSLSKRERSNSKNHNLSRNNIFLNFISVMSIMKEQLDGAVLLSSKF